MSADQPKPRFEPPPWEQEAFEQFQRERAQARAHEDLDAALQAVREQPVVSEKVARSAQVSTTAQDPSAGSDIPIAVAVPQSDGGAGPAGARVPAIPEARIDAMLIQLRGEEPAASTEHLPLINGVIGFMAVMGLFIIVQAARLFAGTRPTEAAGTMLAATLSFMVFLTGIGFLGGAILLFRKYHQ